MSQRKSEKLNTAVFLLGITILAKFAGFFRETLIGYYFGATRETDILYTASGFVSGIVFAMAASVSAAYIPVYIHSKQSGEKKFLWSCVRIFAVVGLAATVLFELSADGLAVLLAPSYSSDELAKLSYYIRWLSLGILFSLLTNLFLGTLNAESIFGYAAISGLVYSGVSVLFVTFFNKILGADAVALSIVFAYFFQCCILFIRTKRYLIIGRISAPCKKYVKQLLVASIPVFISNTTVEINQLVDRMLANGLAEGAVSALAYAHTLFSLVFQVVCNTFITIAFTDITNYAINSDKKGVITCLRGCVRTICLFVFPIMAVTAVSGIDIVRVVFERGLFDYDAAVATGRVLSIYAYSFFLSGLYMSLNKTYYALNDYSRPTFYGAIAVVCNIILSVVGSKIIGLSGIAWATVISNLILTTLLIVGLNKKDYKLFNRTFSKELGLYALAGVLSLIILSVLKSLIMTSSPYLNLLIIATTELLLYFAILLLLGGQRVFNLMAGVLLKEKANRITR